MYLRKRRGTLINRDLHLRNVWLVDTVRDLASILTVRFYFERYDSSSNVYDKKEKKKRNVEEGKDRGKRKEEKRDG